MYDEETDLLVVGSGAAGLTAGVVGARQGLSVTICEKAATFGGTTATSGGAIWIAGSSQARRAGYSDSVERGQEYLRWETGQFANYELIDAFTSSGPEAIDYLEKHTDVLFDVVPLPDYHAESPGGVPAGRVLMARAFDGRALGPDFKLLTTPMSRLMLFGGMMVGMAEIPIFMRPLSSWKAFSTASRILLRYLADRMRYARGTRLLNGNALVARYLHSLRKTTADLRVSSALIEILKENGKVVGAVIQAHGRSTRIRARCGVVLATGGAAQRSDLQQDLMRDFPHNYTVASSGNTGDGVRIAIDAGGTIDRHVASPAVWTPASVVPEKDGKTSIFPYGYLDRGKPGAILIDLSGNRFVNEANSYHDVVQALFKITPAGKVPYAYLICDTPFIKRYGFGVVRPHDFTLTRYVASGYLTRANTPRELGQQIGLPGSALEKAVARHNKFARDGTDDDFCKGSTAYNRSNGDASVKPNANLKEIKTAPFYAMRVTAATLCASIGLRTNGNAQVLDSEGRPIAGLYACGSDATSVMAGYCPGGGVTLGPAVVFGYRAARHAHGSAGLHK